VGDKVNGDLGPMIDMSITKVRRYGDNHFFWVCQIQQGVGEYKHQSNQCSSFSRDFAEDAKA